MQVTPESWEQTGYACACRGGTESCRLSKMLYCYISTAVLRLLQLKGRDEEMNRFRVTSGCSIVQLYICIQIYLETVN